MARRPWSPLLGLAVWWLGGCHGVGYHLDSLEYVRDPLGGYEKEIERDVPVLGWLNGLPFVELRYGADVDDPAELLVEALGALGETELAPDDLRRYRVIGLAAECYQRDSHALVQATALTAMAAHLEGSAPPSRGLADLPFESGARVRERFERFRSIWEGRRSDPPRESPELLAASIAAFGKVGYAQLGDVYPILRLLAEGSEQFRGPVRDAALEVLPILSYQAAWLGMLQGLRRNEPMVRQAAIDVSFVLDDDDVLLVLLRALDVESEPQVLRQVYRRFTRLPTETLETTVRLTPRGEADIRRSALDNLIGNRGVRASDPSVAAAAMVALSRHYADHTILDPDFWSGWYQQRVAAEAENG